MNKEFLVGVLLLSLGIGGLFLDPTKHIAPFLIGFAIPSMVRGTK